MSTVAAEKVLVVPTSLFHELGYFQGFSNDVDRYFPRLLEGDHVQYRPRGEMEENPDFKQLIPYVLFCWIDGGGKTQLFQYQRGGGMGERRLHAKRSVGVGGHVSYDDAEAGEGELVYLEGMAREVAEEVSLDASYTTSIVGLINDDQTEVGRVHLGVVHLAKMSAPQISPREDDVLDARFRPVPEILATLDEFETWSQIAVRALFG